MNKRQRLRHLSAVVRAVPAKAFRMDYWAATHAYQCGTVACALGHAALDPAFQAEGLQMVHTDYAGRVRPGRTVIKSFAHLNELGETQSVSNFSIDIKLKGMPELPGGPHSAAAFFGIPFEDAGQIFMPGEYGWAGRVAGNITKKMVLDRIKMIAAKNGLD